MSAQVVSCAVGVGDCAMDDTGATCANYNDRYWSLQSSEWMLVFGFILMAAMAWQVGANDVANAFGTSVGSRAISCKTACLIGGAANWLGAASLGYGVSKQGAECVAIGANSLRDVDFLRLLYDLPKLDSYLQNPQGYNGWQAVAYLLVMVASLESFAHGANDTANATAPVAAIFNVYDNGFDGYSNRETPVWIMTIAGCFLCLGIIFQGAPVMETIGKRISHVDMHRGFAMELSSKVTVAMELWSGRWCL
ncbi:unnamed protein product [Phytophthora lilii]|uniref:Unnamed protein product n=1 Tax=Phytophthora lilii TaxID=2077276 RepID=A0A9W6TS00_9STRA|nr:unnamed protein product [Phytophthora lilii]